MKEYMVPINTAVKMVKEHLSFLSNGLGFKSTKITTKELYQLVEIIVTAIQRHDRGPWRASDTGDGRVYIESNDFTHDVRFYLNGNFADMFDMHSYAAGIAWQLNSPWVDDRRWGNEWREIMSIPIDRPVLVTCKGYYIDGSSSPMAVSQWDERYNKLLLDVPWSPTHWRDLPESL